MAKVVSIQGEQLEDEVLTLWATDDEVDEFVRDVDERFLLCRDRARHGYRTVKQAVAAGLEFTGVTPDGFLERREVCPDCGAVERVEVWDVRHKRNKITRCALVSSYTHYIDMNYQNKKHVGRMKPRQVREAVASQALGGQSYRDLHRRAQDAQKARQADARKRQLALVAETA